MTPALQARRRLRLAGLACGLALLPATAWPLQPPDSAPDLPIVVARQPAPARKQLERNLAGILQVFARVGVSLPPDQLATLKEAAEAPDDLALAEIQAVLDRYTMLDVNLTDEAWFVLHAAATSPAGRPLQQGRWATFLVKVRNDSRVTSPFAVKSDQGFAEDPAGADALDASCAPRAHGWAQWLRLRLLGAPPMSERLSGTEVEYFVIRLCSLDSGDRAAELTFYLGGGLVSQGHFGSLSLLFRPTAEAQPAPDHSASGAQ